MSDILRSLAITLGISSAVGALFYFTKGIFVTPFAVTLVTQIILSFITNSVLQVWADHLRRKTDNEMYREMSKIGLDTECSYCGEVAYVPIDLSTDNRYTCAKCGKENRVVIDTRSVQTTDPSSATPQEVLSKSQDE